MSSVTGLWLITAHALIRYVERIRPGISYDRALEELKFHCLGAHPVKELPNGIEVWRGPNPRRIRLRVERANGRLELVTVMPAYDGLEPRCVR